MARVTRGELYLAPNFNDSNKLVLFQATNPVASLFITMQHNVTANGKITYTSYICCRLCIYSWYTIVLELHISKYL